MRSKMFGKMIVFGALCLMALALTGCFRRGLVVVGEREGQMTVVQEQEQSPVDRISDGVINAMTPAIVGVELNSDEIMFCQRRGYSSGAFILTVHNKSSLPAKVLVNGKHIPMACEDGRAFLEVPPGATYKIFVEWGATEVALQPPGLSATPFLQYRMNMWYMWGGMGGWASYGGLYGVWNGMMQQTAEITDQFLLQAYANTSYVTYIKEAMDDRAAYVLDRYRKTIKPPATYEPSLQSERRRIPAGTVVPAVRTVKELGGAMTKPKPKFPSNK